MCGRRREQDTKPPVGNGIRFKAQPALWWRSRAGTLIFHGVSVLFRQTPIEDFLSPQDGRRTKGFNVLPVRRTDEYRDQPDYHGVSSQPSGFSGLQSSCKAVGLASTLPPFALRVRSALTPGLGPRAESLVRLVSVIGAEGLPAGPAISL